MVEANGKNHSQHNINKHTLQIYRYVLNPDKF